MTKILIVKGRDRHTEGRIVPGFVNNDDSIAVKTITKYGELDGGHYDWIFVDPSVNFDPSDKINCDLLFFYDCEDDPRQFDPDVAYYALKDKVKAYVKMNYVVDDRKDGIKNIAFPLPVYPSLIQIAGCGFGEFSETNAIPFLLGHGTFIGRYKMEDAPYSLGINCNPICKYAPDDFMYNQRLDWLISMDAANMPYIGGIAFSSGNISIEWQTKCFGDGIRRFEHSHLSWEDTFKCHARFKIGLCPTGHERISWRLFDLMAAGSVIFWTDNKEQQSLIMPKHYITVKDGHSLAQSIQDNAGNIKELWKASQEHKEMFSKLDSKKVSDLFLNQIR